MTVLIYVVISSIRMTSITCRENGSLFIRAMSQLMTISLSLNWPLFIVWDKYLNLYQREGEGEGGSCKHIFFLQLYLWSLNAYNKITPLNLKQNSATKICIYLWFMLLLKYMIEELKIEHSSLFMKWLCLEWSPVGSQFLLQVELVGSQ